MDDRIKALFEDYGRAFDHLVQLTDETPKIILFISHQDEDEAMKEVARMQQHAA